MRYFILLCKIVFHGRLRLCLSLDIMVVWRNYKDTISRVKVGIVYYVSFLYSFRVRNTKQLQSLFICHPMVHLCTRALRIYKHEHMDANCSELHNDKALLPSMNRHTSMHIYDVLLPWYMLELSV